MASYGSNAKSVNPDISSGLPPGWVRARLDECCEIIQGQSPPGDTYNIQGTGLPFFQGAAEFGETYPKAIKWCSAPKKVAEKDDILLSIRAPVGPTNLASEKCCIGRGLTAIRPLANIPPVYILYALRFLVQSLAAAGTGSTFDAIGSATIREFQVPLAPLGEQIRIISEIERQFTRLDAGVKALERTKAHLKRYRASVLKAACEGRLVPQDPKDEPAEKLLIRLKKERQEMWEAKELVRIKPKSTPPENDNWKPTYKEPSLGETKNLPNLPLGWSWVRSEALFIKVTSGSRWWAKYYSLEGAKFIRIGNLNHESITLDLQNIQHVEPPTNAEAIRTRLIPRDILISITADVGMVAIVPDDIGIAYNNQHIALARPLKSLNVYYLAWYLASRYGGWRQFLELQRGATKQGLGLDDILAIHIPIPPLNEQTRIVEEINKRLSIYDKMIETITNLLQRSFSLRQSIFKIAFSGRLVPQDNRDEPATTLLKCIQEERCLDPGQLKNVYHRESKGVHL